MSGPNEIIPLQGAMQLLEEYKGALAKAKTGVSLLHEAKKLMATAFGGKDSVLPQGFTDFSLEDLPRMVQAIETLMRRNFWGYVADKTEIRKIMSIKRRDELDKQIYYDTETLLPEPTEKSVFDFLNSNLGRAKEFAEEAVMEVFNFLRPRKSVHQFKTNDEFMIGPKVLRERVMDVAYIARVAFGYEKHLWAMDNLFRLLDGKPVPKYPDDLVTTINTACQQNRDSAENDYARFRWYKKGSMHIEFKRLDLVAKLNEIAGKALLKG